MNIYENDLMIRKEGMYWTLYIGEIQCGCGDIEDIAEVMEEVAKRIENGESGEAIAKEMNEFV